MRDKTNKTIKRSIRIPVFLHEMVEDLMPLYDNNYSKTLCAILEMWRFSNQHEELIDKLAVMRYELLLRTAQLTDKLKELKLKAKNHKK